MAGVFVLLWASGYVVARLAAPDSTPLAFLALRFLLTVLLLLPMALLARATWPSLTATGHLVVSGLLVHAGYLGGVWCAIKLGMPAGVAALIVNLQPILTAMSAGWLGERTSPRQWVGLVLGIGGVALVVAHRMGTIGITPSTLVLTVFALLAISAGTVYQKRFAPVFDLRTGTAIQYFASFLVIAPLAWALEDIRVDWTPGLVIAMAWSVLALSIGAIFLMFALIARGEALRVTSLFYLVPPVTAVQAWLLFREPFGLEAAAGMLLTAIGVALVQWRR